MAKLIITQNKTITQVGNENFEATIWLGNRTIPRTRCFKGK